MDGYIVIVEDDQGIRDMLEVALTSQGYATDSFENAAAALKSMEQRPPDLVIMDIMMDGLDGVTAVNLMRSSEHLRRIPVIMLTAKDTEEDKIAGLDSGADDYVTKPFSVLELCARVRAQLRRLEEAAPANTLEGGDIRLSLQTHEVTNRGVPIDLTFKEFELLACLMKNKHRVLSRSELLDEVWGSDFLGETRTLDMHVGSLRQKLRDTVESSRFIKTIRGIGYRFVGGSGH